MSISRTHRRRLAWAVPAATVATIATVAVLPSTATASPHPTLPAKTAGQLLAAVQTTTLTQLSGTLVETARLGLPTLPGGDNASALSLQTLIAGTHTAQVWFDGPDKQRVALLGQLSESDVIHSGTDLWTYESGAQKVRHTVLPAETMPAEAKPETRDLTAYTPQGAAAKALKAIDPSTKVTVDRTARVAGRAAYTLVLTPRDARSTVREVAIAIDAKRNVPLRVQVFGAAAKPAFEIAFTDVSFSKPAASVFRFTPPKGATVTDLPGTPGGAAPDKVGSATKDARSAAPKTLGAGWASVLELPAATDGSSPLSTLTGGNPGNKDSASSLVTKLTTTLPGGDRLLRTALVNVLMTADGRTFVGAVTPSVLQQAAAGTLG